MGTTQGVPVGASAGLTVVGGEFSLGTPVGPPARVRTHTRRGVFFRGSSRREGPPWLGAVQGAEAMGGSPPLYPWGEGSLRGWTGQPESRGDSPRWIGGAEADGCRGLTDCRRLLGQSCISPGKPMKIRSATRLMTTHSESGSAGPGCRLPAGCARVEADAWSHPWPTASPRLPWLFLRVFGSSGLRVFGSSGLRVFGSSG